MPTVRCSRLSCAQALVEPAAERGPGEPTLHVHTQSLALYAWDAPTSAMSRHPSKAVIWLGGDLTTSISLGA